MNTATITAPRPRTVRAGGKTLMQANAQWSNRPADQRFGSLADMLAVAEHDKTSATVAEIKANALRAIAVGPDVVIEGDGIPGGALTNWSFGQLAHIAKAPPAYLRTLSPKLAAAAINEGLASHADAFTQEDGEGRQLLFSSDGVDMTARAITSQKYGRVWNADLVRELIKLEAAGTWQPAPEAFDGSRGLYLGDRDMFCFMVDNDRRIFETDKGGGLGRGFFLTNNEVGGGAFNILSFLYEYVCGNHRVWGAQNIEETRVIHIGGGRHEKVLETLGRELVRYAGASAKDDEAKIKLLRGTILGKDKAEVVGAIAKMKIVGLTKGAIEQGYDKAEQRVDWYGNPNSVWGFNGGLTEVARDLPNGDERNVLDLAAGAIMEKIAA